MMISTIVLVILGCANTDTFPPILTLSIFLPVSIGTSYDNNESRNYGLYANTFPGKIGSLEPFGYVYGPIWSRAAPYMDGPV